jgi:hypothetical protein
VFGVVGCNGARDRVMQEDPEEDLKAIRKAWQERLGRLRLNAEPIQDQVIRHLRVTWVLTGVVTLLGAVFFTLFTGFGRPDIGSVLVCVLTGPILSIAWYDYFKMKRAAESFGKEMGFNTLFKRPLDDE